MKISKLNNEQLDYWVAKAQGWKIVTETYDDLHMCEQWNVKYIGDNPHKKHFGMLTEDYTPSTNWQQAGELLERYQIAISYPQTPDMSNKNWIAQIRHKKPIRGMTPQQAICVAVIASVYGEEVDD